MTDLAKQILRDWEARGFQVLNVRTEISKPYLVNGIEKCDAEKMPCVFGFWDKITGEFKKSSKAYGVKKWEIQDFNGKVNYEHNGFGLRLGETADGLVLAVLDFDNYGSPICNQYCEDFYNMCDDGNGWFKTSTIGNQAVLFDYSKCPKLIKRLKGKIVCDGLEIMNSNGCQQVMPPTMTTCKREGKKVQAREWHCDQPIKHLEEGDKFENWIINLLDKYQQTEQKTEEKKTKIITPSSSDEEKETKKKLTNEQKKWIDALEHLDINGLAGKGYGWKMISALKNVGLQYDDIKHWGDKSTGWDWRQKWSEIQATECNAGYLVNIMKKENPDGYAIWSEKYNPFKQVEKILEDEIKMLLKQFNPKAPTRICFTDNAMADAFKILYGDRFLFCCGNFYHFNDIYWKKDNKTNSQLHNFIDTTFYKDMKNWIIKKIVYYGKKAQDDETDTDEQTDRYLAFWNKMNLTTKDYLRNVRSKTELIKAISSKICNDNQKWDLNPYAFVFENCVFDLKLGKQTEPNPKDFMTTSCGWEYQNDYQNPKIENYMDIEQLIPTIQKDENVRNYLLKAYSSCMVGLQSRNVYLFTGVGGNGKSVLDETLTSMLGDYAYVLPKTFLTQPFKDGACPEAVGLHNKRCVIVSEPDANKNLCCSSLKAISGDAKISARKCFGDMEFINLIATSLIECNSPPNLDEMNKAMTDRLGEGVIKFESQFVKQSEYDVMTEEQQKECVVGNEFYKNNIQFKIANRQLLFNMLLKYINIDVPVPDKVRKWSAGYCQNSDTFYGWFCDNYEKDENGIVKVKDIHTHFKMDCGRDWTKNEKDKYSSIRKFEEGMRTNVFLRKFLKERDEYYNNTQLKSLSMCGWKEKPKEDENNPNNPV